MEFVAAKCPNCAGELRLPDDQKKVKCMYWGYDVLVREAINAAGANVENLLKLATNAEETGNSAEAYKYFTQVLEYEPDNSIALMGKGVAAGLLSTSLNFRADELIKGVEAALALTPEEQKETVKLEAAEKVRKVCEAFNVDTSSDAARLQRYQLVKALIVARDLSPADENILTSLYFQYRFNQIHTEGQMSMSKLLMKDAFDSTLYDKLIASHKVQVDETLQKIEALNPELATRLRDTASKSAIAKKTSAAVQSTSGCLVWIVGVVVLLCCLFAVYL